MKMISKFTCIAAAGLALAAFTSTATAETAGSGGCCAVTPTADSTKSDVAAKPYALDTCIVTDEKLDADPDMKSYSFVHEGQEIKLCCKSCKKKFDKEPAKYLKKLAEASAKK